MRCAITFFKSNKCTKNVLFDLINKINQEYTNLTLIILIYQYFGDNSKIIILTLLLTSTGSIE